MKRKIPILKPNQSYTFRSYYEMPYETEDILAELGYSFVKSAIPLPHSTAYLDRLENLKTRIVESLPFINLSNESARREFLIAPVLIDVLHYTQARLSVEYFLNVTDQLKGSLDYYLRADQNLLVIEAKNADLAKGFTQLAVELIAFNEWTDIEQKTLEGAVSIGDVWRFAQLDRETKQITQDLALYRVPEDLELLLRILVGILKPEA